MTDSAYGVLWIAIGLIAVLASAIFSGVETGVYRVNRVRLRLRSESGDSRAKILVRLLRDQTSLLTTLLIAVNTANYAASSAIVALCSLAGIPEWQILLVVPLLAAPVLLVLAEIVPKNIFQNYSDRYTYSFAGVMLWCRRLLVGCGLLPLTDALTRLLLRLTGRRAAAGAADQLFHPRQQIGRLLAESSHQGVLTPYQSFLVDRVMNLRSVRVSQVMVPLSRAVAVPANQPRDKFIAQARTHHHARVVAFQDRPANAVGVIHVNEVLGATEPDKGSRPLAQYVRPAPRLKADWTLVHALFTLQQGRAGLGLVVDKAGATVGIVTIRDLVDEIVGEIEEW